MRVATVVLDIATQALDQGYSYQVPDSFPDDLIGRAVLVPFGNRKAIGFVVSVSNGSLDDSSDNIHDQHAMVVVDESSEPISSLAKRPVGVPDASGVLEQLPLLGFENELPQETKQLSHTQSLHDQYVCAHQMPVSKRKRLKEIEEVLTEPYFTERGARLALHMAHTYLAPLSACVRLLTPPGGVPKIEKIGTAWVPTQPVIREVDDRWVALTPEGHTYTPAKNATKQRAVLAALSEGALRTIDLRSEFGSVDSVLKTFETKGLVTIESRRKFRSSQEVSTVFAQRVQSDLVLTPDQQHALEVVQNAYADHNGQTVVLEGVTGSGKTEVYLCALDEVLAQGQSAVVLVPEISLTPQTVARFRNRFGDTVAVIHSRMSQGERYDQWEMIRTGQSRVVVGARSALFAPVSDLGMIIIDEEHESSYKQDQAPRYVTRDVAAWLVRDGGATLVLGSATPSIEALYCAKHNPSWHHVQMLHRANGRSLPPIHVVDMAREFGQGSRSMFSRELREALFETLDSGQKAVLLLNQRGFAQFLLCRDCGYVPTCASCSTSLTYHEQGNKLVCHHCGYHVPVPPRCPECGSPYLKRFGAGTQRVESELYQLLVQHAHEKHLKHGALLSSAVEEQSKSDPIAIPKIVRMDADTTARKGDHQRLLEQFMLADSAVLLGTQMIAKGLDFDEVTLVGVINADTMLNLPDYKAMERTFNLIEQVAGRCGRGSLPGRVIVQTYEAFNPVIRAVAHHDRDTFLENELTTRADLSYPPFVELINILFWGNDEQAVSQVAQEVYRDLLDVLCDAGVDNWELYPPQPCVLSRLKRDYRYHCLIKVPRDANPSEVLAFYFRKRKPVGEVHVSVDIDPDSLL